MSASNAERRLLRSRRSLLWGMGLFAILDVLLAVVLNCWRPELRDPVFRCKHERLLRQLEKPAPLLVLTVGTSRLAYGLDGRRLGQSWGRRLGRRVVVFNFGILGGGSLTEELTVRRLLREGIRPDALLVEVFPPVLAGQPGVPGEGRALWPTWFRREEQALARRFGVRGLRRCWRHSWLLPWYEHRLSLLNLTMPVLLNVAARLDWPRATDTAGWLPLSVASRSPGEHRQAELAQTRIYASVLAGFSLGGPGCEGLRRLLQLCHAEAIPVGLVLMPEATVFRNLYPARARQQIDAFLAGLGSEFGADVIDARDWLADEVFYDGHHLLQGGAEAFTERLGREWIPALFGRPSRAAQPGGGSGGSKSNAGVCRWRMRALVKAAPTAPSTTR